MDGNAIMREGGRGELWENWGRVRRACLSVLREMRRERGNERANKVEPMEMGPIDAPMCHQSSRPYTPSLNRSLSSALSLCLTSKKIIEKGETRRKLSLLLKKSSSKLYGRIGLPQRLLHAAKWFINTIYAHFLPSTVLFEKRGRRSVGLAIENSRTRERSMMLRSDRGLLEEEENEEEWEEAIDDKSVIRTLFY